MGTHKNYTIFNKFFKTGVNKLLDNAKSN